MKVEVTGQIFSVIIAIEDYMESSTLIIPSIEYVKNDAKAFENMLIETLKVPKSNIHSFINEEATLEAIEDKLPKIIEGLSPFDTFFFYYAGHAYSTRGENLFTLFNSNQDNLKGTSAYFDELLLEPLSQNPCRKAYLFMDCSSTELLKAKNQISTISNICEKEFIKHTDQFSSQSCFFSASIGQKSYSSSKLKLGIWAWHLIEALSGEADKALDRNNAVTISTLKKYLSRSIPTYLTKETKIRGTQEPFAIIGSDSNIKIVEFDNDQFDDKASNLVSLNTEQYELRRTERELYKNFTGYVKGRNSEPKRHCTSAETWAERLTEEEIKQEIEDVYKNAKVIFGYKKRECQKDPEGGYLATPPFRYRVTAFQDEDDFRSIKTTRVLELRMDMGSIPAGFDTVFPKMFEDLYIPVIGSINLDDLTEAFEDLEDDGHGELTDEEGKLIFSPKASKGVENIIISDKGIIVNFSTSTESIQTMLGSTQEAFGVISAPISKLLE
ncbi:MAG: caspase family protein [Bdellovibrionales bacterium]|nr:caspase family protein [Bdellovibrionales bacterium]